MLENFGPSFVVEKQNLLLNTDTNSTQRFSHDITSRYTNLK